MPFLEVAVAHDTTEQAWDGAAAISVGRRSVGWSLSQPGYPRLYLTAHVLDRRLHWAQLSLESSCCQWPILESYSYGKPDGQFICEGCGEVQQGRRPLLLAESPVGVASDGQETYERAALSELARWLESETSQDPLTSLIEARELLTACAQLIRAARYDEELTPLLDL